MSAFKVDYYIEIAPSHAGSIGVALWGSPHSLSWPRTRRLQALTGGQLKLILFLIFVQSCIGGVLVLTGTSTHWLFLHLGMATGILALITWSLLLLLRGHRDELEDGVLAERKSVRIRTWSISALCCYGCRLYLVPWWQAAATRDSTLPGRVFRWITGPGHVV